MSALADAMFMQLVHPERGGDALLRATLRQMAEETGVEAFQRQQRAIITRPDSRPSLAAVRCPTLIIVGEQDQITPPVRSREIAAEFRGPAS